MRNLINWAPSRISRDLFTVRLGQPTAFFVQINNRMLSALLKKKKKKNLHIKCLWRCTSLCAYCMSIGWFLFAPGKYTSSPIGVGYVCIVAYVLWSHWVCLGIEPLFVSPRIVCGRYVHPQASLRSFFWEVPSVLELHVASGIFI